MHSQRKALVVLMQDCGSTADTKQACLQHSYVTRFTRFAHDGVFNDIFVANLPENMPAEEF